MKTEIVLGFDFGSKQIGVAVGQTITASARPLTVVRAQKGEPDWDSIDQLIQKWQPQALVVGTPIDMYGQSSKTTYAANRFAKQLQQRYQLPVDLVDEKLTTREAKMQLIEQKKRLDKATIDAIAAQLILQAWFDS
ncbi:MAG: Holliday junction resolvase RuvX [Gammaproteobacteria bacterium]|nr:Holliday junction resolvase RuvX [Gammaproteobacteria bacterium]MCP4473021.1 Holliday junction resolvase RuvX [Gammaproteobacteria bacterium]